NKIRVNLVDGKFIPTVGGIYTIEYSVSDIFGNKTVKTVQVEAVDVQPSINVEFENEIDYNGTFIVAEKIKLFDSIINQQSAYGDISIKTYAELKSNPSVKYELTYENGYSFTPLYSGAYDIVIEISDYSLTEIIEKELMVDVADVVYYQQVAPFPNKLIKNGTYNLDVIKAYSLASGEPVEVELELSVFNDSNSTEEVVNASNMVISANRNIKLTYKPVGLDFTAKPFEVELGVLRTGLYEKTLVMRNYFYAEAGNLSFSADTEGISCEITNKVNDIASFYFANILAGHDFYLNLFPLVDEGSYIPFDRLNCYLYDATNSTNFVKASFISQDGMWFVSLNDGDLVKIFDSWGEEDCLELNFNSQKNVFIFDNLYTEKGVEFFGTDNQAIFRDGIILKLEILATNDCQGIKIEKINNQVISSASIDFTPAIIDMTHDNNAGEKKIGETIKLEKFVGYDVLTPNVKTVVTVQYRPTKESMWTFVKSVDEVVLKNADASRGYEFVLDKYGEYNVNVKVVDDIVTDNGASRSYTIFVNDYNKPVVNITSKTTSGKVGESIKLAKFETEKNLSELSYYFVIVDVDGYYNFTKETSFTANKAGKYKVTLVVLDGNYNMAQVSYNIMVK
ncbi:MAG: hypothetical protein J6U92_08065, partial [Clostridia bacterium]|nr:hypothetical protein [Clostridia bacterium]